jgi:hypothetical protein
MLDRSACFLASLVGVPSAALGIFQIDSASTLLAVVSSPVMYDRSCNGQDQG